MSAETPTWMRSIRDAGYSTSLFGKLHLHPHSGDLRDREHLVQAYGLDHVDEIAGPRASKGARSHMTDRWEAAGVHEAYRQDQLDRLQSRPWVVRPSPLPLEHYADVYVGQQAKTYLQQYDAGSPWFCWVSFGGPHEPWDAPEPYASMFDPDSMPPPIRPEKATQARPRGRLDRRMRQRPPLEPHEVAQMRANYAGNMALIDDQIGEILGVVEERGEADNTVVALISDHGEMNGDFGLLYKQNFLNASVRVPFLINVPRQDHRLDQRRASGADGHGRHPRRAGRRRARRGKLRPERGPAPRRPFPSSQGIRARRVEGRGDAGHLGVEDGPERPRARSTSCSTSSTTRTRPATWRPCPR